MKIDIAVAVVVAALVLIVSPGLAISGLIAVVVLLVCGVSLARETREARREARRPRRRSRIRLGVRSPRPRR